MNGGNKEWTHIRIRTSTLAALDEWIGGVRSCVNTRFRKLTTDRKLSMDEAVLRLVGMAMRHRERGRGRKAKNILKFGLTVIRGCVNVEASPNTAGTGERHESQARDPETQPPVDTA